MDTVLEEIAAVAARLVVDEGLDYGPAKHRAVRQLGLPPRTRLPDNQLMELAVREHLTLFCSGTQPAELAALRELALVWMDRLAEFRPYLCGAVWNGTATRLSDIDMQLFCDDSKSAELALINRQLTYDVGTTTGWRGDQVDVLSLRVRCEPLDEWVGLHLRIHDLDDLRGALRPDASGRKPRGDAAAVRACLSAS